MYTCMFYVCSNLTQSPTPPPRTHGAMKQAFKNSVLEKLSTAFSSSQFERQYTFQEAFTLQIPSKQYTDKLSKGALFKLMEKEMEVSSSCIHSTNNLLCV